MKREGWGGGGGSRVITPPSIYAQHRNPTLFLALQVFHATFDLLDGAVLRAGSGQVGQLVQALLPLADVPVQTLGQRIEPVGDLVLGAYAGHRVDRGCHVQAGKIWEIY